MKNSKTISLVIMKNLIYKLSVLTLSILLTSCSDNNSKEWTYIFDGETFNGWHVYNTESIGIDFATDLTSST